MCSECTTVTHLTMVINMDIIKTGKEWLYPVTFLGKNCNRIRNRIKKLRIELRNFHNS